MNGAAGKRRTIITYHKGYSKHRGWSALVSKVLKTILDLTLVLLPTSFGKLRWKILTTKRLERRAVKRFRNVLIQHNWKKSNILFKYCLLYTSDAADE